MDYFHNKVVCITGSSKGIGKATAIKLGGFGAKLVLNGRGTQSLNKTWTELQAMGIECLALAGDVSKKEDCKKLIDFTIEHFGKLDILINNAGISARGKFGEVTADTWEKVIQINTLGCIYPTTYATPHLLKSKGHVVYISSIGGKLGLAGHSPYGVSKMGLTSLVKALNIEYSKKDLHAGIVYVGFTENESDKTIMNEKGEYVPLKPRKGFKLSGRDDVAHSIAKLIVKRKSSVTLTVLGKVQGFCIHFMPFVVTHMLKNGFKNYDKMYS